MYLGKSFKVVSSSTFPTEGTEKGLVCEEASEDSGTGARSSSCSWGVTKQGTCERYGLQVTS